MSEILKRLESGEILICDGSVGIMLQSFGCSPGESVEKWGLENERILRNLHRSYIEAGADIIITNTLGGNRLKLKKYGLDSEVESLNEGLAAIALDEALKSAKTVYVAGNLGPTSELMEPYGDFTESEIIEVFSQQARVLVKSGVDFIFIETMIDQNEAAAAVKAVRESSDLPIFAAMSFNLDKIGFRTPMGHSPEQAVKVLLEAGSDVVGANCGGVLAAMLPDLVKQMKKAGAKFVVVEPNAGIPAIVAGKTVFPQTPQEMAESFPAIIDAGANVIGGCCGTTPEHIRLIAQTAREHIQKSNSPKLL